MGIVFIAADATNRELVDLVQELEVMKRFNQHENIINLVGCMTQEGPLYVIAEYARHGNLRDFLRTHRPMNSYGSRLLNPADDIQLTHKHLVSFAHQIAVGMEYLATKQVPTVTVLSSHPVALISVDIVHYRLECCLPSHDLQN